jgi:hypothetical protein
MKMIEIFVFKFQELSPKTQNRTLEKYRETLVDDWWYEPIIEGFKERLERLGYWDIDCFFSGFYSQGDGASFIAKYGYEKIVNPDDEFGAQLNKLQEKYNNDLRGRIMKTSSNYVHEGTMIVDYLETSGVDAEEEDINQFRAISRELARILYKDLEKEYDYLTSDNSIANYFTENETYFHKNGEVYADL